MMMMIVMMIMMIMIMMMMTLAMMFVMTISKNYDYFDELCCCFIKMMTMMITINVRTMILWRWQWCVLFSGIESIEHITMNPSVEQWVAIHLVIFIFLKQLYVLYISFDYPKGTRSIMGTTSTFLIGTIQITTMLAISWSSLMSVTIITTIIIIILF